MLDTSKTIELPQDDHDDDDDAMFIIQTDTDYVPHTPSHPNIRTELQII